MTGKVKGLFAPLCLIVLAILLSSSVPVALARPPSAPAAAVGRGFTYQGQLKDGTALANGPFEMEFRLYDALSGGSQVGPTITRSGIAGVTVTNGVFTVTLDFGDVFDGSERYLEIGVRPLGGASYTTLSPRQALTPAPYAITSLNALSAPWTGVTGKPDLQPKYARTIVVSPVGDGSSATANGTALLTAMESITVASATNPYLLKIEPGIYDLGNSPLTMKDWVDVEGSGVGVTTIQRAGSQLASSGTVEFYVSDSELRFVTIANYGGASLPAPGHAVGIFSHGSYSFVRLSHVAVKAFGAPNQFGVYLSADASLAMADSTVDVTGGTDAQGLFISGFFGTGSIKISRSSIIASGATSGDNGVYIYRVSPVLDDVTVTASGGTTARGVSSVASSPTINSSVIKATGASTENTGVFASTAGTAYVNNSQVIGSSYTIYNDSPFVSTVKVGASKLDGGATSGLSIYCAAVYDENYAFYAGPVCP